MDKRAKPPWLQLIVEGHVTILEPLSAKDRSLIKIDKSASTGNLTKTAFLSRHRIEALLQPLPAYTWPAKDTGPLEGYMIVYIRTDRTGKVRESYWSSSDNYGLQDAGIQLALQASLKPTVIDGLPVQVEGPLILHFKTIRATAEDK